MTAFANDPNLRAFRLVAAFLSTPVAQPTWTDALIESLMLPLPLVDCDPLLTWLQTSAAEGSVTSESSLPNQSKTEMPVPQPIESATLAEPSATTNRSTKLTGSGSDNAPLSAAFQSGNGQPDRSRGSTSAHFSGPTVPSRPQNQPQNETVAHRVNFSSSHSRVAPFSPSALPSSLASSVSPSGPEPQTQAAPPLSSLAEIGRLTGEILAAGLGTNLPRSRPAQTTAAPPSIAATAPTPSSLAPTAQLGTRPEAHPIHPPPSTPSPKLNLANLATVYAQEAAGFTNDEATAPIPVRNQEFSPMVATTNTASTTFSTSGLGDFSTLEAAPLEWGHEPVSLSGMEMAETLTEMVSAILQAQAQRHGVDLS